MKISFIFLFVYLSLTATSQTLVINEVMASNAATIADEDGDYTDWLELYNSSNTAMDLSQYWLTDDKDEKKKWHLPAIQLLPSEHLLVFCSGKDRLSGELHTNFKISAAGEKVRIYNESGVEIDQIESIAVFTDQSFGSKKDGSTERIIFEVPTPGFTNGSKSPYFNAVRFSQKGGIYSQSFNLELIGDDTTELFYTLDGSIPSILGIQYSKSIALDKSLLSTKNISDIVMSPDDVHHLPVGDLPQVIVLRAAKFYNGKRISPVSTQTYLIKELTFPIIELPIVSIATDSLSLFSQDTGIFVPGIHFDKSSPNVSGNYFQTGEEWERLINVEYFSPLSNESFNQECGLRTHGSGSRKPPQKAMRIYARSEYGKSTFDGEVLIEKPFVSFKRLILKPFYSSWSQNGCTDYIAGRMAKNLNLEYLAAEPILLFVNGEYWGIYYLQERLDERYLEQNTEVEGDSIDIIESWFGQVNEGNNKNFNTLYDFINDNDLKSPANYAKITEWIDIDNFIDYQIFQAFISNYDWPDNNMKCWRERREGAKWRWIFFDADGALENITFNGFAHSTDSISVGWPTNPRATLFLRKLLKNNEFKTKYTSRLRQLLNDELHITGSVSYLDNHVTLLANEITNQSRRFGKPISELVWEESAENLRYFLSERACWMVLDAEEIFDEKFFVDGCDFVTDIFKDLKIVPNPTTGYCQVVFTSEFKESATIQVLNLQGQEVIRKEEFLNRRVSTVSLDLAEQLAGIYFVRIQSANQTFVGKILLK
ncbi:MAG: hypothetical protein ACI8S2_000660 [Bacteroidia bacterium]|jgi:hypothetical protein